MQSNSLCVEEVMAWNVALGSARDMNLHKDDHVLGLFSPGFSPRSQDLSRGTSKRQHQSMLSRPDEADEDELGDELGNPAEKKRRLTIDQVKFLEMSFNTDLKLEPERKALIAKQLGLRPRQVAIWFQNRRARWKNKQLEQDYEMLKAKYEAAVKENENIKKENEAVREDNRRLQAEVDRLSSLLQCSDNQANCNVMDGDATLGKSSTASDSESGLKEEQSSGKSGLTSPTKSSDDQSEIQDSGRSYPTSEEAAFNTPVPSLVELDSAFLYSGMKLESEYPTLSSDELFGNLINPRLLQQLAVNGVYFEDAYNIQISWEDQMHGYSW